MTLKKSVAINVALAFSILIGLAAVYIYASYASFRREEFRVRLTRKALTMARLLLEVKEIDRQLLKLIDQNTINKLYDEKILVFDENKNLVYSSIGQTDIEWKHEDLDLLNKEKSFYRPSREKSMVGLYYDYNDTNYYVLIAAVDQYGNRNIQFIIISLITTFIVGVVIVWATAYFFIKELLKPLDVFQELATTISANQLDVRLKETSSNDEINLLSKAFNQMLLRIEQAFDSQKAFTSNASHELRTPLARVAFQIENLLSNKSLAEDARTTLKSIHSDVHQLSDLVNSLLLLSKFTRPELQAKFEKERIDEIIFKASEQVKKMEPAFELDFEIIANETIDNTLEISGVKSLLEIVFINLLKNACIYSFNKKIKVKIEQTKPTELKVIVSNQGNFIPEEERSQLFQPFFRGTNASNTQGSGLGLRITKRILDYHQAGIEYKAILPYENQFVITFES